MNTAKRNRNPGTEYCLNSDLGIPRLWGLVRMQRSPWTAGRTPGEITELWMFSHELGFFTGTGHSQTRWTEGNQAQSGAGRSAQSPRLAWRGAVCLCSIW